MALSIDGTATGSATGGTTVGTSTTTLSTTNAGDIIVVLTHAEAVNAQGNFPTVSGISGGSLTWAKRSVGNFGPGGFGNSYNRSECWWAYASGTLTNVTITATWGGVTIDDMTIIAFGVTGFTGGTYSTNPWDSNSSLPAVATGTTTSAPTVSGVNTTAAATMVLDLLAGPGGNNFVSGDIGGSAATAITHAHNGGGTNNSDVGALETVFAAAQTNLTVNFAGNTTNGWIIIGDALAQAGGTSTAVIWAPGIDASDMAAINQVTTMVPY